MDSEKERYSRFFFFYLVFNYQLILTRVSFILSFLLFFYRKSSVYLRLCVKKKKINGKECASNREKFFSQNCRESCVRLANSSIARKGIS